MTDTDLAAIEARLKHAARLAPAYATVGGGKDVALLAACYDAYRKAEARAIAAEAREARLRGWLRSRDATEWSAGWSDDFRRGYDTAVEEVRAALAPTDPEAKR